MISKCLPKNSANQRKGGFKMKARKFVRLTGGLIYILILLTACSGGGVDTSFSVNNEGVGFLFDEPSNFAYETFTIELAIVDHKRIWLEAVRGNIEIEGQVDADSIIVTAEKRVGSDSLEDAEEHMNELEILVTDKIDKFLIQTLQPENPQDRSYVVDYYITLPSNLEIDVFLTNGDIDMLDIQNSVMIDAVNGDVFLSNIFGNAVVDLTNGNINSTMDLPSNGEIRMSTDNGNLYLSIPTSTSAEFSATVDGMGEISVTNLDITYSLNTQKLLIGTLGDGEGSITLSTVNGNVDMLGVD
jgi:hypothetical protein